MATGDDDPIPREAFTPPRTVSVTPRALELAERFQASVPSGYIVAFCWFDGGRTRKSDDEPWVDLGPHLDLGAYRVDEVPQDAVCRAGSVRYAVLIDQAIVDHHPEKKIDLDDAGKVVLR